MLILCTYLQEIGSSVGIAVTLCAIIYSVHSIYYMKKQRKLLCKAASYDLVIKEFVSTPNNTRYLKGKPTRKIQTNDNQ